VPERLAVGIDIGGTKIAGGVVDEDGRVLARSRRATPSTDPLAVLDAIADLVEEFRDSYAVRAVGVGAAGYVDVTGSTVVFSPHLAWRNEPLRDAVVRRTRLPVLVDNDANAAGWAEWRFGAAQNQPDVVLASSTTAGRASAATAAAGSSTRVGACSTGVPPAPWPSRPTRAARSSTSPGHRSRSTAAPSPSWPGAATRRPPRGSRTSGAGSASGWPTSRRPSTPTSS